MGSRRARGDHHPIEPVFSNGFADQFLGVLTAGEKIIGDVYHMRQRLGVVAHPRHVDHTPDVDPTVAHENAHTGFGISKLFLGRVSLFVGQGVARVGKQGRRSRRSRRSFHDRVWNVLRTGEGATNKDAGSRRGYRRKSARFRETAFPHLDLEFASQFLEVARNLQTHGEDDHVENFALDLPVLISVGQDQIGGAMGSRFHAVNARANKAHPDFVPGAIVVTLEVLAVSAHVHKENGGIQRFFGMFLGNDRFLDGVHAAHAGTVSMSALLEVAGADTLEPCNLLGFGLIGRPHQVSLEGTGGTQNALEFHTGDNVGVPAIAVGVVNVGVKRFKTRRQNDRTHVENPLHRLLFVRHGLGRTGRHTHVAFGTNPAGDTARRFSQYLFLGEAQLHFGEVLEAFVRLEPRHVLARNPIIALGGHVLHRQPFLLAPFLEVLALNEPADRNRRLFSSRDSFDDRPGAGDRIAPGENIGIVGL